jgi:hypothetical protein
MTILAAILITAFVIIIHVRLYNFMELQKIIETCLVFIQINNISEFFYLIQAYMNINSMLYLNL